MVQLKYFGDNRDFFKYDLITTIFDHSALCNYVFVPMLTAHRHDNEGKKKPTNPGDKSKELFEFINSCKYKSLKHWEIWLSPYIKSYKTLEPVDEQFFSDEKRDAYWSAFLPLVRQKNALIFVDPDTGLETGKPWYLKKMGREKYILNHELRSLIKNIDFSSVLMLYQHLPNNKHKHFESVGKKLTQIQSADSSVHACAYREDDLAFIFIFKNALVKQEIQSLLQDYHTNSNHKYKSLHFQFSS
jgi:hypothetical protein